MELAVSPRRTSNSANGSKNAPGGLARNRRSDDVGERLCRAWLPSRKTGKSQGEHPDCAEPCPAAGSRETAEKTDGPAGTKLRTTRGGEVGIVPAVRSSAQPKQLGG